MIKKIWPYLCMCCCAVACIKEPMVKWTVPEYYTTPIKKVDSADRLVLMLMTHARYSGSSAAPWNEWESISFGISAAGRDTMAFRVNEGDYKVAWCKGNFEGKSYVRCVAEGGLIDTLQDQQVKVTRFTHILVISPMHYRKPVFEVRDYKTDTLQQLIYCKEGARLEIGVDPIYMDLEKMTRLAVYQQYVWALSNENLQEWGMNHMGGLKSSLYFPRN